MGKCGGKSGGGAISEMVIVDTFTRLIFSDIAGFGDREQQVVRALRHVDDNVALDDDCPEMGRYLRSLGVAEMIQLVARVRFALSDGLPVMPGPGPAPVANIRSLR